MISLVFPPASNCARASPVVYSRAARRWRSRSPPMARLQLLALDADSDLAKATPKIIRYRFLHLPAVLVCGQRVRHLKVPRTWPWAKETIRAFARILAPWNPAPSARQPTRVPDRHPRGQERTRHQGARSPDQYAETTRPAMGIHRVALVGPLSNPKNLNTNIPYTIG